jgi:hypothetical protein
LYDVLTAKGLNVLIPFKGEEVLLS